ncbi:hypothetical protein GQ44DRAFT_789475, partial [Phaeosphaeriaceae sp. PMI808]
LSVNTPATLASDAVEEVDRVKSFDLHSRYAYVTWSNSTIDDEQEFYRRLLELVPPDTDVFGGKEYHENGHPHYHVVMRFPKRLHWPNARVNLMIVIKDEAVEEFGRRIDTEAINIKPPEKNESIRLYLERTQAYAAKDDNPYTFGTYIRADVGKNTARKRAYADIDKEENREVAKRMLRELDPTRFIRNYGNVMRYLESEKKEGIS